MLFEAFLFANNLQTLKNLTVFNEIYLCL